MPAASLGGTGTPWYTPWYTPGTHPGTHHCFEYVLAMVEDDSAVGPTVMVDQTQVGE